MEERVAGFSDNPPPTVKRGCSRMLGKWKSAAECAPQEPPLAHNRRRSPPPRVGRRRPFFAQVERMDWARPIVGSQTSISFSRRRVSVFGRFVSKGFFSMLARSFGSDIGNIKDETKKPRAFYKTNLMDECLKERGTPPPTPCEKGTKSTKAKGIAATLFGTSTATCSAVVSHHLSSLFCRGKRKLHKFRTDSGVEASPHRLLSPPPKHPHLITAPNSQQKVDVAALVIAGSCQKTPPSQ